METQVCYNKVAETCLELWPKTCFTSLQMLDYLVKLSGRTWDDFVRNPSFKSKKADLIEAVLAAPDEDLRPLCMGLCTSWCITVSQATGGLDSNNFGDQGHHRAAYTNDGIVVDSTARKALWLSDKKTEKVGRHGPWKGFRPQMQGCSP